MLSLSIKCCAIITLLLVMSSCSSEPDVKTESLSEQELSRKKYINDQVQNYLNDRMVFAGRPDVNQ